MRTTSKTMTIFRGIIIMASYDGRTFMLERLRRKPVQLLLVFPFAFFYMMTPIYDQKSFYVAFPNDCNNTSCQKASSTTAGLTMSMSEEESHPDYVVYSLGCKIMEMNPYDKSVAKFLKPGNSTECSQRLFKLEKQKLTIDEKITKTWKSKHLNCCYRVIHRVNQQPDKYNKDADWGIRYSSICHNLPVTREEIIVNDSFIKIECNITGKIRRLVEFQGIALPPKVNSESSRKKAESWDKRKNQGLPNPPSILIIGIDSISRMHMKRSLPKSRQFLQNNDFVELRGYNKVGENTFPNIMAGFVGMDVDKYGSCWPNESVKFDDCPFIWKNFSDLNYMTAFLEDSPGIAIFNLEKAGFVLPPADYYMRPLTVAMHKHNRWNRTFEKSSCVGGMSPTDFQAKFIKDFVINMGKDYPYFLLSWFTSIGHDDFNGLKTADDAFLNLLSAAMSKTSANPDNTIIIFMSDHGYRYGEFRETFLGFYEESLPFFYFRLPSSLKERYPDWYPSLKRNSGQLTSPFDLHSTLTQILYEAKSQIMTTDSYNSSLDSIFSSSSLSVKKQRPSFKAIHTFLGLSPPSDVQDHTSIEYDNQLANLSPSSPYYYSTQVNNNLTISHPQNPQYRSRYSFFEYIPGNRTCESSSIPQRYCMCGVTPVMSQESSISSRLGNIVVAHINYKLKSLIKSRKCAPLKFSKFLYGREVGHGETWNSHKFITHKDFLVALEVGPSKGHFEAKTRIMQNSTTRILGDITRINSYKGDCNFVSDSKLKPFCWCKRRLKIRKIIIKRKMTPMAAHPSVQKASRTFPNNKKTAVPRKFLTSASPQRNINPIIFNTSSTTATLTAEGNQTN